MRDIFGVFFKENVLFNDDKFVDIFKSSSNWQPEISKYWIGNGIYLGQHSHDFNLNKRLNSDFIFDDNSECAIVADASIYYKKELAKKLNIERDTAINFTDKDFLLKAYLHWGKGMVNHIIGDFAFVIWDQSKEQLFCARDHIGCRPLYFYNDSHCTIFSSEIEVLRSFDLPNTKLINDIWMRRYLTLINSDKNETQYDSIKRLEPAHCMLINNNSEYKYRYWDLGSCDKLENLSEEQIAEELYRIFQNAVKERCESKDIIGLELSGGLDSSSIAIAATEVCSEEVSLITFSHVLNEFTDVFAKENFDEQPYIRLLLNSVEFAHSEFIDFKNEGIISTLPIGLKICSHPIFQGHSIFSPKIYCQSIKLGCSTILSGFGGDEFVSNKATALLKELSFNGEWRKLWRLLLSIKGLNLINVGLRFLKLFLESKVKNSRTLLKIVQRSTISSVNFDRYDKAALSDSLLKSYTKESYNSSLPTFSNNNVSNRQYQLINSAHITDRLESTYLSARSQKIEYRYPMLDVKLLEFYCRIPSDLKFKNGISRYIFRRSLSGHVPDEIVCREKGNVLFVPSLLLQINRDKEKIWDLINESEENNKFDYLNYKKLRKNLADLLNDKKPNKGYLLGLIIVDLIVLHLQKWQREGKIDIGIKC